MGMLGKGDCAIATVHSSSVSSALAKCFFCFQGSPELKERNCQRSRSSSMNSGWRFCSLFQSQLKAVDGLGMIARLSVVQVLTRKCRMECRFGPITLSPSAGQFDGVNCRKW